MMGEQQNNSQKHELPTSRLSVEKQFEILKAIAIIQSNNGTGSSYKEIASKVDANANNVSSSLKFWKDIGLIAQDSRGTYSPTNALVDFNQKIQWGNQEEAWKSFSEAIKNTWFVTEITIKSQLKDELTSEELTRSLGLASGVSNKDAETMKCINNLVQILETCGLVKKMETGSYKIISDKQNRQNQIFIDESKDLMQIKVSDEVYAIDIQQLKDFVVKNGKKISTSVQRIE